MKRLSFALFLALLSLLVLHHPAQAADVVGNESYEISWHGTPPADGFIVYFGQTDTNKKENSVSGLSSQAKTLRLNLLKKCTQYSWNMKALRNGRWEWQWATDQTFTTAGVCSANTATGSQLTTARGTKATVAGVASATASWTPVDGATRYNVYYKEAGAKNYTHSVMVGPKTTSVTINHLSPTTSYSYRVAGYVNNKEVWQDEKVLKQAVPQNPVLGTSTNRSVTSTMLKSNSAKRVLGQTTNVLSSTATTPRATCTEMGSASVSVRVPNGVTAEKVHVYYGTEQGKYVHALRDLRGTTREVTINHLSCATYYYQVAVVGVNGRVHWQGEKMMSPTSL